MTILHVVAPGEAGGLERVVHLLAAGQSRRGHKVHVAGILEAGDRCVDSHPYLRALAGSDLNVHEIRIRPRAYRSERMAISNLCRAIQPDIAHTHGYRPDVVDGGVARAHRIPTVTTVHGFTGGGIKNRLYERLQQRVFREFSGVVAVSEPLARRLARSGVAADHLHVVPNAWSGDEPLEPEAARLKLGVDGGGTRIGWVGRLSSEKGPDILIDALPLLADLPFTLSILGDGPERRSLELRAQRRGVGDRIRWHGVVPEAGSLFRAFDLFVMSSRTEGSPMVLFEAMAAAVPVVATSVGGIPQIISDREGLLVPPEARALANAIRAMLVAPRSAQRRARNARERLMSDFASNGWIDAYESIYDRVRSRNESGGGR